MDELLIRDLANLKKHRFFKNAWDFHRRIPEDERSNFFHGSF